MNYQKIYDQLVARGQERGALDGYKERHHIIPRSHGGSDDKSNLVDLTFREHYIAHLLLVKIHPKCWKMKKAMSNFTTKRNGENVLNSHQYEKARILSAEGVKRFYDENPEAKEAARQKSIQQFADPEIREAARQKSIQQFADPKAREAMSERKKQYYADNPEAREAARQKSLEQFANPEAREAARQKSLEQFANPEAREAQSKRRKQYFANPAARESQRQVNLAVQGKYIEVTFCNGETLRMFGRQVIEKELGGVHHIGEMAKGTHVNKNGKPWKISCKGAYAGRKIVAARYISKEEFEKLEAEKASVFSNSFKLAA